MSDESGIQKYLDLNPKFEDRELVSLTVSQLRKDLQSFGERIVYENETGNPYDTLFAELLPIIKRIDSKSTTSLQTLLYRVDVSEMLLKKLSNHFPDKNFHELVTDLIIRRELLKVIYRKYY